MLALHCVVILGAFCVALCVCSVIRLELVVCSVIRPELVVCFMRSDLSFLFVL